MQHQVLVFLNADNELYCLSSRALLFEQWLEQEAAEYVAKWGSRALLFEQWLELRR